MQPICTSIFDLFKIGPGPSSSHTIGPMLAGLDFINRVKSMPSETTAKADSIEVRLLGSLSATGKGHGTDRAVLAGLLGHEPESCPNTILDDLLPNEQAVYDVNTGAGILSMGARNIVFDVLTHDYPYSNTLIITLYSGKSSVFEMVYYSVGGGFLQWEGWEPPKRGKPVYPYSTMEELKGHLRRENIRLHTLMLANETAITGMDEKAIHDRLDTIIDVMDTMVTNGLNTNGVLPGPIGLHRKAPAIHKHTVEDPQSPDHFLTLLSAYAFAASEENAQGHKIVTAPTAGSCGVLPSVIRVLTEERHVSRSAIRRGLLAAAAVGFLAKANASIAGADVGCQGEVGVASAMAGALIAYARGHRFQITENAAEIALEHHLGLTCDPVGGYVQIPCIERNAMGAVKAYNAFIIARSIVKSFHMVGLDQAIRVMNETGRDMCAKYKETSQGGLATCMPTCVPVEGEPCKREC